MLPVFSSSASATARPLSTAFSPPRDGESREGWKQRDVKVKEGEQRGEEHSLLGFQRDEGFESYESEVGKGRRARGMGGLISAAWEKHFLSPFSSFLSLYAIYEREKGEKAIEREAGEREGTFERGYVNAHGRKRERERENLYIYTCIHDCIYISIEREGVARIPW